MTDRIPTFVDLFCGCGGLSLGLERAGLKAIAAIDKDGQALDVFRKNLPHVQHVLERNLTEYDPEDLECDLNTREVEIIVGGPPCQGFSTARQRDGANHGDSRLVEDERRNLYREFLRYVAYFRPKIFVIENVPGIRSAAGGQYFTRLQQESRQLRYRVHSQTEDAWELGLPQKRRRQLVFGIRDDITEYFRLALPTSLRSVPRITLAAAIGDLPKLRADDGEHELSYDLELRARHLRAHGAGARKYLFDVLEVEKSTMLRNHVSRPHSARDLRDFSRLREGENSAVAMRSRKEDFEFPYDRSCFKDRFTRQNGRGPCSTIVAHLAKDGLMFIHPTQNRSLTPREAARIQSFPDWFEFPKARTQAFRMIGNAVPPLVAESIGVAIKDFLRRTQSSPDDSGDSQFRLSFEDGGFAQPPVTAREREVAGEAILPLLGYEGAELLEIETGRLLCAWKAALYLFPLLHPVGVLDSGSEVDFVQALRGKVADWEEVFLPRFARSGWPVALEPIAREAYRRFLTGQISENDFYPSRFTAPQAIVKRRRRGVLKLGAVPKRTRSS